MVNLLFLTGAGRKEKLMMRIVHTPNVFFQVFVVKIQTSLVTNQL